MVKESNEAVRYAKVEEIIRLAIWIHSCPNGVTLNQIAERLDRKKRTAERIRDCLLNLFCGYFDEIETLGRIKYWGFSKDFSFPLINITSEELANLEFAKKTFISAGDELKAKSIEEIINKIKSSKKNAIAQFGNEIEALLEAEGLAVRQHPRCKIDKDIITKIRDAIKTQKKLQFNYPVKKELKTGITVYPYGLLYGDKTYLVGFSEYTSNYRLYIVSKIINANLLDESFTKDKNFNLSEYAQKSFGIYQEEPLNVVLKFSKEVADEVKNYHFHPTQELIENIDGSITVKFSAAGSLAICGELFKWGADVKILAPQELKDIYRQKLSKILERNNNN